MPEDSFLRPSTIEECCDFPDKLPKEAALERWSVADKSPFITLLRSTGKLLPGDRLKTAFYLNFVARTRKAFRLALTSFYRMDHIYEVLREAKVNYRGNFSILEFGVADGYAFTKKLYATRYLEMEERVQVHGFDSFEGMPATTNRKDQDLIANDGWVEGQFRGNYESLSDYCASSYNNYELHKGYFEDTLTPDVLSGLSESLPILIWIDCDYYTSAKTVFEKLIPYIPSGCVVYFDEYEFNYGSRFTGEARIVHEINAGEFGEGIELVLDTELSLNSQRVYRFINLHAKAQYERTFRKNASDELRRRTDDSPLP